MSSSEDQPQMIYNYLGKTGLKVSALSLGSWLTYGTNTGQEDCTAIMAKAKELGINFIDCAEVYAAGEAESLVGQAIKDLGWERDEFVISTKIFWGGSGVNQRGLSRKHLIEGTRKSLKRLQLEYVDLLFAHRPDNDTPMEETVRAFNYLIENGYAFYWGTSEWSAQQLQEAHAVCDRLGLIKPVMEQPEYNMFNRTKLEKDYLPLFASEGGLGTTTWSPLNSGILTGKYNDGIPEGSRLSQKSWVPQMLADKLQTEEGKAKLEKVRKLTDLAGELGCSMAQLAVAWCAKNPNVSTVILGASKISQLEENVGALQFLDALTDDVMEKIDAILDNAPEQERNWR